MTGRESKRRGGRGVAIGAAVVAVAVAMVGAAQSAPAAPRATTHGASAAAARTTHGAAGAAAGSGRAWRGVGPLSSGTPAGWAPVPFQRAQLSAPGSWLVESRQQLWCFLPGAGGMIFAGVKPTFPKSFGCGVTASRAWMLPAGQIPKGIGHRKPTAVIHGIRVYRLPSAPGTVLYLAPQLGVRVGARGKLARRVLDTLTRSPLSVVLSGGPQAPVPGDWIRRQFGGVRFATPRSWGPQREDQWSTCGTGLLPGTLLLVDATKPPLYLPCPYPIPYATADAAQPGLTVVTGKYAAESVAQTYPRCQRRHDVRICLSSVTGQGGFFGAVLIFSVSRPHQHASTFFLLGLSGSGARARTIFNSIRLAA